MPIQRLYCLVQGSDLLGRACTMIFLTCIQNEIKICDTSWILKISKLYMLLYWSRKYEYVIVADSGIYDVYVDHFVHTYIT